MSNQNYLIWMDLEMTGLDANSDTIIEIATIITDNDLNIIKTGPEYAIHQSDSILDNMNEWCQVQHNKSGLVGRVKNSEISMKKAETDTLDFMKEYVEEGITPLCGNSIHQDRNFLKVHMPDLDNYLHYRNIDISSIKELVFRWYPDAPKFEKKGNHTALDDIKESIEELRYYRKHIFR